MELSKCFISCWLTSKDYATTGTQEAATTGNGLSGVKCFQINL